MASFQRLFTEARGKPIEYNGRMLHMVDRIKIKATQKLEVTFESANSEWRQGIGFDVDGRFEIGTNTINNKLVLWQDTAPATIELLVHTNACECLIKNVWDTGDGVIQSWHNGAAMIIENLPNGRRYCCNDGRADDDFDDIVFRIAFK